MPDLEKFDYDLNARKKISMSYCNKKFGGSVAEVNNAKSKKDKKTNPLL